MSYATLAQFKSWFAGTGQRIDAYMQESAGATRDARLQEVLDEASGRIDSAASLAGYTVPINTTTGTLATQRAALLEKLCIDLVMESLSPGTSVIPEGMTRAKSRAQEFLDGLAGTEFFDHYGRRARGGFKASLPGLNRSAG